MAAAFVSVVWKHDESVIHVLQVYVPAVHDSATIDNLSVASIIKGCLETDPALRYPASQVNRYLSCLRLENGW